MGAEQSSEAVGGGLVAAALAPSSTKNVDKRTSRRQHKAAFVAAIDYYRANQPAAGVLQPQNGSSAAGAVRTLAAGKAKGAGGMRVLARKRPLFEHELGRGEFDAVTCPGGALPRVAVHDAKMRPDMRHMYMDHHEFKFDAVFNEEATNDDVYQSAAAPLVRQAAGGGYATAMMFGQTGSGKTYTMGGIYERACAELFARIEEFDRNEPGPRPVVSVSFIEVAGTSCRDMLNGGSEVTLLTDGEGQVCLQGVAEAGCFDAVELLSHITEATKLRATSETGVHDASSRSHAICRVYIRKDPPPSAPFGQFSMVDLAGSERREDSRLHDAQRRKESAEINSSLMALKECIRARVAADKSGAKVHIPFRDHKLTQLLKQSFTQADASTIVISTISPSSADTEHTLTTLHHSCLMDGQKGGGRARNTRSVDVPPVGASASAHDREVARAGDAAGAGGGVVSPEEDESGSLTMEEVHPTEWTAAHAVEWWVRAAPLATKAAPSGTFGAINAGNTRVPPVPKQFSGRGGKTVSERPGGKELLAWSRQRFVKECGQQERVGNLMYDALRTTVKALRELKTADNNPKMVDRGHGQLTSIFSVTPPKKNAKKKPAGKTAAQVAEERAKFSASVEAQKAAIAAEADEMMKALEAGVEDHFDWDPTGGGAAAVVAEEESVLSEAAMFSAAAALPEDGMAPRDEPHEEELLASIFAGGAQPEQVTAPAGGGLSFKNAPAVAPVAVESGIADEAAEQIAEQSAQIERLQAALAETEAFLAEEQDARAAAPAVAPASAAAKMPAGAPEPLEWGGHIATSEFKPSQLSRLCRDIGASDEQMDACADGDDPKAEYMALLRPSWLARRCEVLGCYSEEEMAACADAEQPQLAFLLLVLEKR